jgi:hypothetical protein
MPPEDNPADDHEPTKEEWEAFEASIPLSKEEFEILEHTIKRAANQRYCGNSQTMRDLVSRELMTELGNPGWSIDSYFTITDKGWRAYNLALPPKPVEALSSDFEKLFTEGF